MGSREELIRFLGLSEATSVEDLTFHLARVVHFLGKAKESLVKIDEMTTHEVPGLPRLSPGEMNAISRRVKQETENIVAIQKWIGKFWQSIEKGKSPVV